MHHVQYIPSVVVVVVICGRAAASCRCRPWRSRALRGVVPDGLRRVLRGFVGRDGWALSSVLSPSCGASCVGAAACSVVGLSMAYSVIVVSSLQSISVLTFVSSYTDTIAYRQGFVNVSLYFLLIRFIWYFLTMVYCRKCTVVSRLSAAELCPLRAAGVASSGCK